jgi:protein ImuB
VSSLLSGSRRYLAVWFPFLSTDRVHRLRQRAGGEPDKRPLVVLARVKSALRIAHADRHAQKLGMHPGLTLADARTRIPDLSVEDEDGPADLSLLHHLADWCDRYTPLVGIVGRDGLTLDITGCDHLFGGEAALRHDLMKRLEHADFSSRSAIAGTPDAAQALARYSLEGVVRKDRERAAIRPLPLAALGLSADHVTALARAGLKTIGDVADRPRPPLAARFGADLLNRLARTLGEVDSPISPRVPLPKRAVERRFAEPIGRSEDVLASLHELAAELAPLLEGRGEEGRLFEAGLYRADGAVRRIRLSVSAASHRPDMLTRLFHERLDALADPVDPGFGFDMIRLSVLFAEPRSILQASMDGGDEAAEEIAEAVDRLGARFNPAKVVRFTSCNSHSPERESRIRPCRVADHSELGWRTAPAGEPPLRPLRLFTPPEPLEETMSEVPDGPPRRFRWRRVMHEVVLAEGPERIAPEWWRADSNIFTRDYFRVEDREGHRFWLYREGLYGTDAEHPRWYMHGLFA